MDFFFFKDALLHMLKWSLLAVLSMLTIGEEGPG